MLGQQIHSQMNKHIKSMFKIFQIISNIIYIYILIDGPMEIRSMWRSLMFLSATIGKLARRSIYSVCVFSKFIVLCASLNLLVSLGLPWMEAPEDVTRLHTVHSKLLMPCDFGSNLLVNCDMCLSKRGDLHSTYCHACLPYSCSLIGQPFLT